MGSLSPIFSALFGGMFGGMGNMGMNIQTSGNNGMNRINFMSSGGLNQNSFQEMIFNLMNSMNVRP